MEIESRELPDSGAVVARLEGRFDAHLAPFVRQWIDAQFDERKNMLIIDLTQVNFVDSAALATLVHGLHQSRKREGDFLLVGLRQPVRIIFELTRMDKAFGIYPSAADAEASLRKHH